MQDAQRPPVPLLRSLEGLRFIASVGIVAIHFAPHLKVDAPAGLNLFVDMFFVISGIVIGRIYTGQIAGWGSYGTFLRRRLARIYPLHLATLLFYVVVSIALTRHNLGVDMGRFDRTQIIPNLLLVHAWGPGKLSFNFPSWSVSAEFFVYLAFPALSWFVTRGFRGGLFASACIAVGAIAWAELAYGTRLTELHWDYGPVRALPSFCFGIWLAAFAPRLAALPLARWSVVIFNASAILAALEMAVGLSPYSLLLTIYAAVASGTISDLRDRPTFVAWHPLSNRGYLTYSLYMLHVPVSTVFLSFVFPRLLGEGRLETWLGLAASVAILFVLAHLSFRFFEDPLRRRIR